MTRRCRALWLLEALGGALARLPQGLLLQLGVALSCLASPLLTERRAVIARNLQLCFPELDEAARTRLARASLRNTVTAALENLRAWLAPASIMRPLVEVTGIEHLRAALAHGRGAVLVGAHFTPMEIGCRAVSEALGEPVHMLVRRHRNPCLEQLADRGRRRRCERTLDKKDLRGMLESLRAGHAVIYAADQDFNREPAFVPFFGVAAATVTMTSRIVRRSGAPLLPLWFHRRADGRYCVSIEAAWADFPGADAHVDAARLMAATEARVRLHPEQYLWAHRRFKTRPAGEPALY